MRKLVYISALLTILMASCQGNKTAVKDKNNVDTFFIDSALVIHARPSCGNVRAYVNVLSMYDSPVGYCGECMSKHRITKVERMFEKFDSDSDSVLVDTTNCDDY